MYDGPRVRVDRAGPRGSVAGDGDVRGSRHSASLESMPVATGAVLTYTGAYDTGGALVHQEMPGGISQDAQLDVAGEPVGMSYSGQQLRDAVVRWWCSTRPTRSCRAGRPWRTRSRRDATGGCGDGRPAPSRARSPG